MIKSHTGKLPTSLPIGRSIIRLEQDETVTLAFIQGMTAGVLTYEVYGKKASLYDSDLILMIRTRQNTRLQSPFFNTGFVLGNISSLVTKGVYQLTNNAFCEGFHEGLEACTLLSHRHTFTCSELCSLLSWQHRGKDTAFNAGYIVAFIQGLTRGGITK